MEKIKNNQPDNLSRRNFIRQSSLGLTLLAFSGSCSLVISNDSQALTTGKDAWLTREDHAFFSATLPVIIGAPLAEHKVLNLFIHTIDTYLKTLPPISQQEFRDLLALLTSPIKGAITGVWKKWEHASRHAIEHFLEGWRTSSLELLKKAYGSLINLSLMQWYGLEQSWPDISYPGPPYKHQLITRPNNY
ncbi:hypothetical protein [Endozoicomonas sp. Mp262]|uniref:hypothetical protein n=1 Tax=Endozoicomonas sp. Mp262 TaxID=2919499 RepID=UPI0021D86391